MGIVAGGWSAGRSFAAQANSAERDLLDVSDRDCTLDRICIASPERPPVGCRFPGPDGATGLPDRSAHLAEFQMDRGARAAERPACVVHVAERDTRLSAHLSGHRRRTVC